MSREAYQLSGMTHSTLQLNDDDRSSEVHGVLYVAGLDGAVPAIKP